MTPPSKANMHQPGVIIFRPDDSGCRLLLLRNRGAGHWGFPKGRRDPGDAHEVATALREATEETGYENLELDGVFRREVDYVVRNDGQDSYPKRVTYFLARAPESPPQLSPEHDEFMWADEQQAQDVLGYGQLRDMAQAAFDALRPS